MSYEKDVVDQSAFSPSCGSSSKQQRFLMGVASASSSKMSSYLRFLRWLSARQKRLPLGKWQGGGKSGSSASLKLFSSMAGMTRSSTGQLTSRQGLQLTSISQGRQSRSIMKSSPKISKLLAWRLWSRTRQLALTMSAAISRILARMSRSRWQPLPGKVKSRQRWNSEQASLLAGSCLWQCSQCFWMASLVRWTNLLRSSRANCSLLVRMQPSLYQQALRLPPTLVSSMQWRRSNLRLLQSSGRLMQACTMQVKASPFGCFCRPMLCSTLLKGHSSIACPRLLFSPGFTIHSRSGSPQFSARKAWNSSQSLERTWQVRGRKSKGSLWATFLQQRNSDLKRFFFEPIALLRGRWLLITSVTQAYSKGIEKPSPLTYCSTSAAFSSLRIFRFSATASSLTLPARFANARPDFLGRPHFWLARMWSSRPCVQQKLMPGSSWLLAISHQNLRLRMDLTRRALLPWPMQALHLGQEVASSYLMSRLAQMELEKLTLKRNSRQFLIFLQQLTSLSLTLSWKPIRFCRDWASCGVRRQKDLLAAMLLPSSSCGGFLSGMGSLSTALLQTTVLAARKGLQAYFFMLLAASLRVQRFISSSDCSNSLERCSSLSSERQSCWCSLVRRQRNSSLRLNLPRNSRTSFAYCDCFSLLRSTSFMLSIMIENSWCFCLASVLWLPAFSSKGPLRLCLRMQPARSFCWGCSFCCGWSFWCLLGRTSSLGQWRSLELDLSFSRSRSLRFLLLQPAENLRLSCSTLRAERRMKSWCDCQLTQNITTNFIIDYQQSFYVHSSSLQRWNRLFGHCLLTS